MAANNLTAIVDSIRDHRARAMPWLMRHSAPPPSAFIRR
jgi:hypothetical protein